MLVIMDTGLCSPHDLSQTGHWNRGGSQTAKKTRDRRRLAGACLITCDDRVITVARLLQSKILYRRESAVS